MVASMKPDGVANFATAIVFIVVDTIAVLLRLLSKRKNKRSLGSDDYWMLVALAFFYVWAGLVIYSVIGISGTLEILTIPSLVDIQHVTKILWIACPIFPFAITSLKISILCFYRQVFPLPWFKIATHVLTAICVLWLFSGFWVIIFQCTPYRAVFDFSLKPIAKCLDFGTFVFVYELLNASIDVAILALPALVVPTLQLKLRRKIQVLMIFFMGGFVLITCVLRMVYSYNPKDPLAVPSYSKGILWSTIELGIAIICGNLPTYRPLLRLDNSLWPSLTTWISSLRGTMNSGSTFSSKSYKSDPSSNKSDRDDEENLTSVSGIGRSYDSRMAPTYPMNCISVENRIEVSSTTSY